MTNTKLIDNRKNLSCLISGSLNHTVALTVDAATLNQIEGHHLVTIKPITTGAELSELLKKAVDGDILTYNYNFTIEQGATVTIPEGVEVYFSGASTEIINSGTIVNNGTLKIASTNSMINNGTIINNWTIIGTIVNNGELEGDFPWSSYADTTWYNDDTATTFNISTAEQLAGLAELVNAGNNFSGKTINITADIDLLNKEWTPIGKTTNFSGNFDGQNHTISNLTIKEGSANSGLFGNVVSHGIKNITIANAYISHSGSNIGALVGYLYGSIENCHVIDSNIETTSATGIKIGGLVGYVGEVDTNVVKNKLISNTVKNTTVKGYFEVGGIAGTINYGCDVSNCTSENVTVEGGVYTGNYAPEYAEDADENLLPDSIFKTHTFIGYVMGNKTISVFEGNKVIGGTSNANRFPAVNLLKDYCAVSGNYVKLVITEDMTIAADETIVIPVNATLEIKAGVTVTNNGTIENSGTFTNDGILINNGTLTHNDVKGTIGTAANKNLFSVSYDSAKTILTVDLDTAYFTVEQLNEKVMAYAGKAGTGLMSNIIPSFGVTDVLIGDAYVKYDTSATYIAFIGQVLNQYLTEINKTAEPDVAIADVTMTQIVSVTEPIIVRVKLNGVEKDVTLKINTPAVA